MLFATQSCSLFLATAFLNARSADLSLGLISSLVLLISARAMWSMRDSPHRSAIDAGEIGAWGLIVLPPAVHLAARWLLGRSEGIATRIGSLVFAIEQIALFGYWSISVVDWSKSFSEVHFELPHAVYLPRLLLVCAFGGVLLDAILMSLARDDTTLLRVYLHVSTIVTLLAGPGHGLVAICFGVYLFASLSMICSVSAELIDSQRNVMAASYAVHCILLGRLAFVCSGQRLSFGALHVSNL